MHTLTHTILQQTALPTRKLTLSGAGTGTQCNSAGRMSQLDLECNSCSGETYAKREHTSRLVSKSSAVSLRRGAARLFALPPCMHNAESETDDIVGVWRECYLAYYQCQLQGTCKCTVWLQHTAHCVTQHMFHEFKGPGQGSQQRSPCYAYAYWP